MLVRASALPRVIAARRAIHTSTVSQSGGHEYWWGPEKAAGREYVGHGSTGDHSYQDRLDYWYPAIRFRKEDDVIRPIRAKEKADWKNLSLEEKKLLYRYSFRQTLAEYEAPTGYWKLTLAVVFAVLGLATSYATFLHLYVYPPQLPGTFQDEYKEAQAIRMAILQRGAFIGPASKWDHENQRWK